MKVEIFNNFCNLAKAKNLHKLGIEYEFIAINKIDKSMISYDVVTNAILNISHRYGFKIIYDDNINNKCIIGMKGNNFTLTLEPGCQIEISLIPFNNLLEIVDAFNDICDILSNELNEYDFLSYGVNSIHDLSDIPFLNKTRYCIMKDYMFSKKHMGNIMMKSTCAVQFNVDYSSQQDAYRKFLASILVQPILLGLFANSPFLDNLGNTFASYRSYIWQNINNKRSGIPSFIFLCNEDNFFEYYIDYCCQIPMTFMCRNNKYIVLENKYTFNDLISNKIGNDIISGIFSPIVFKDSKKLNDFPISKLKDIDWSSKISDWYMHLNTIFTESRLQKGYIEFRSIDSCSLKYIYGLADFWLEFINNNNLIDYIINNMYDQNIQNAYKNASICGSKNDQIYSSIQNLISQLTKSSISCEIFNDVLINGIKDHKVI